jgi:phage terminase large subunit
MQLRPASAPAAAQTPPPFRPPARKAAQQLPEWARCLFENQWNFISLRGGRGSAKTESVARALVMRSTVQPLRVLCTREVQLSIKESVYSVLCKVIKNMGLSSQFEILSNEIRSKRGGSFIFRGLADESIDSLKSLD